MDDNPHNAGPPNHSLVATAAARFLPDNAVLISNVDPVYLEHELVLGTHRQVLPMSRRTPYASALLARHRIEKLTPPPRNAADQACAGLLAGGARRLYAFTADEEIGALKNMVAAGIPVYLDNLSSDPDDPARLELQTAFGLETGSIDRPWLVQLRNR